MSDEHHTPEQVEKAFAYAPTVLRKLKEAGIKYPSLNLYEDASGRLELGTKVTNEQYDLAVSLVRSQRQAMTAGVAIDFYFCCGLVQAAEEAG